MIEKLRARLGFSFTLPAVPPAAPILIFYLALGAWLAPAFLSQANVISIMFSVAALLPAVLGTQLLLVLGRFDLSVGATASLAGMVCGVCLNNGAPVVLSVSAGLAVGALLGLVTGAFVARFRIDPLIATLAMMGMVRSLCLVVNGGRIAADLPSALGWIANARLTGIPVLILFAVLFVCLAEITTKQAVLFRRFYAVGSNAAAASHAGINVSGIQVLGYVFAGLGAAATGLVQTSRSLSASPLVFETLAIEAITACILGGSTLAGGRGGIVGATIGLIAVAATDNLVVMLDISVYWKGFAVGLLLLLVVLWSPAGVALRRLLPNHSREKHA